MWHETVRALKVYSGGQAYCLDVDQVLAIERGVLLKRNPAGDGPIGWITKGRRQIPVHSLAERLSQAGHANRSIEAGKDAVGAVLVMNGANPWGLAVERVSRFQDPPAQPHPVPAAISQARAACFRGIVVEDEALTLYLSPEVLSPGVPAVRAVLPKPFAHSTNRTDAATRSGPGRMLLVSPPNPIPASFLPNNRSRLLFALSYSQVAEIVLSKDWAPIPSAPPHVLGLAVWRQRPVALLDTGRLFGFEPTALEKPGRMVIARSPVWQTAVAIPIGRHVETRTLPIPHRPWVLPGEGQPVRGVFEVAGDVVIAVLDVDALAGPRAAA